MKYGIKTPDGTGWSGLFLPEHEGEPANPQEFWPVEELPAPEGFRHGIWVFDGSVIRRELVVVEPPTQEEIEDAARAEQDRLAIEAFKSHPRSDPVADLVRRVVILENRGPNP